MASALLLCGYSCSSAKHCSRAERSRSPRSRELWSRNTARGLLLISCIYPAGRGWGQCGEPSRIISTRGAVPMYWTEFLAVALIHLLALASPRPDFAIVVRESVAHGRRA